MRLSTRPPPGTIEAVEIIEVDLLADKDTARAWIEVMARSSEAAWGQEHSAWTLAEVQGRRRGTGHSFVDLAAVESGRVVGMAAVAMPLRDNPALALLMLHVDPDHRRVGIGSALARHALDRIAAAGRTIVQAETEIPYGTADCAGPPFAEQAGFASVQTVLRSAMPLPADRDLLVRTAAGEGVEDAAAFRIDWRVDDIPDEWLPGLAVLAQRMSTDAPQGEMSLEEEHWTADRVRENLDWALGAGRRIVQAVAFEGDAMVGYTQLEVSAQTPTLAYQQDTLVLREVRGNRLGLRLKAAAALALMDELPQVTRVRTWNADDNRHMLAVNDDLGYQREGVLQVWEKSLPQH